MNFNGNRSFVLSLTRIQMLNQSSNEGRNILLEKSVNYLLGFIVDFCVITSGLEAMIVKTCILETFSKFLIFFLKSLIVRLLNIFRLELLVVDIVKPFLLLLELIFFLFGLSSGTHKLRTIHGNDSIHLVCSVYYFNILI